MKPEIVMDFFIFPNSNPEWCIDDVFLDELTTMVQIKMRSIKMEMVESMNVERVTVLGGDMLRHSRQIGTL